METIKKFLKAIQYGGCSEGYNIDLSINKNGKILAKDLETKEEIPFKKWLEKQQEAPEEIIENIQQELNDQLYEENRFFFDDLTGEDFQLILNYRYGEGYGDGDDDFDEIGERIFLEDLSDEAISLRDLLQELKRKRNHGLRKYSDKTKEKAKNALKEWLEMCEYLSYNPFNEMEELLRQVYNDERDYDIYFDNDWTLEELASKAIENFPILCSSQVQNEIRQRISSDETAQEMCQELLDQLKKAFPKFYKEVKKYKGEYKESVYCFVKLKETHLFHPQIGRCF